MLGLTLLSRGSSSAWNVGCLGGGGGGAVFRRFAPPRPGDLEIEKRSPSSGGLLPDGPEGASDLACSLPLESDCSCDCDEEGPSEEETFSGIPERVVVRRARGFRRDLDAGLVKSRTGREVVRRSLLAKRFSFG